MDNDRTMAIPVHDVRVYIIVSFIGNRYNDDTCISTRYSLHHTGHSNDVTMGAVASQITSLTIVYSTVDSDADQSKHQISASLAFVRGIRRGPLNSPHKLASNAEIFSIWWRHHAFPTFPVCRNSKLQFDVIICISSSWYIFLITNLNKSNTICKTINIKTGIAKMTYGAISCRRKIDYHNARHYSSLNHQSN